MLARMFNHYMAARSNRVRKLSVLASIQSPEMLSKSCSHLRLEHSFSQTQQYHAAVCTPEPYMQACLATQHVPLPAEALRTSCDCRGSHRTFWHASKGLPAPIKIAGDAQKNMPPCAFSFSYASQYW